MGGDPGDAEAFGPWPGLGLGLDRGWGTGRSAGTGESWRLRGQSSSTPGLNIW